nr:MAG TPA: hypothetical protein [Caudoviricetes sp.]
MIAGYWGRGCYRAVCGPRQWPFGYSPVPESGRSSDRAPARGGVASSNSRAIRRVGGMSKPCSCLLRGLVGARIARIGSVSLSERLSTLPWVVVRVRGSQAVKTAVLS